MLKKFGSAGLVIALIGVVFLGFVADRIGINVDESEIVVTQDAYDGDMTVYSTPGFKWIWFASTVTYPKRGQIELFPADKDGKVSMDLNSKEAKGYGAPIRFNDKGGATFYGQFSYTLPTDEMSILKIRTKYPSKESLENRLILPVITKSIYMTGPTMSSEESAAARRAELIATIMDMINYGPWQVVNAPEQVHDPITDTMKTVNVAKPVVDANAPNGKARQEVGALIDFGVIVFNPEIKKWKYDDQVEKQIESQRRITMEIQTAVADTNKAQQEIIKVEKEGEAEAAKAKWLQEKENATEIALAEKNKKVAKLAKEAAVFTKAEQILLGQGEAERKRLVMQADGALEIKIKAYENVNGMYAKALSEYKGNLVPQIVMSGQAGKGGTTPQNAIGQMMELFTVKTAKDLALDMKTKAK